jgi:hypothetical protein
MIRRRWRTAPRGADDLEGLVGRFKAEPVLFGEKGDVFYRALHRYN